MSALLRILAPLLNVVGIALLVRRRRLVQALNSAGADAPARAIVLGTNTVSAWWVGRLSRAGVIRQTPEGRYWLDQAAHRRYRRVRLIRVAVILGVVLAGWAVWTMWLCCPPQPD